MRAVIQRVGRAAVRVDNAVVGEIGAGLLVLLGVGKSDTATDARYVAEKVPHLRIFEDAEQKLNLSVVDIGGSVLVVSQFTLFGDCRKGRRPSFTDAAEPALAERLYRNCVDLLKQSGVCTAEGIFQATMEVELVNAGPLTILLDSRKNF